MFRSNATFGGGSVSSNINHFDVALIMKWTICPSHSNKWVKAIQLAVNMRAQTQIFTPQSYI